MPVAGPVPVLVPASTPLTPPGHIPGQKLYTRNSESSSSSFQQTMLDTTTTAATNDRIERVLGDTEASYFLPSRGTGVNDMYLHLGFRAPPRLCERERVRIVWALLRTRHPLLASRAEMHSYTDIRFVYRPPHSVEAALDEAASNLEYCTSDLGHRSQTRDEVIDAYFNGPRTLSEDRLSHLIILCDSKSWPSDLSGQDTANFDLLFCTTHYLCDGLAVHQLANDFFGLLGSSATNHELTHTLSSEWQIRCGKSREKEPTLPRSLEERAPLGRSRFREAVSSVDFKTSQDKLIGDHTIPRRFLGPRRTVTPIMSLDERTTKHISKHCKSHGVTISSAVFALCNIAWAKTFNQKPEMPMMMYSAVSLRPYLVANAALDDSYCYLAIGYFNVVLPSFLPRSENLDAIFWRRARSAQKQSTDAAQSPMAVSRAREMARQRASQARAWAKEDDEKAAGTWVAPPPLPKKAVERPPSNALMGVSLLGNLDKIYKHSTFGDIRLNMVVGGGRQRSGGIILFGYTFAGKLWITMGYDENGLEKSVVREFWKNFVGSMGELLQSPSTRKVREDEPLRARL